VSDRLIITRRAAVGLTAIILLMLSGKWLVDFFATGPRSEMVKKITGFYRHKEDAALIGLEYLDSAPDEADSDKLIDLLCHGDSENYRRLADADWNEAHAIILAQQHMDFSRGRIVDVSGWLLSETEARVCALTALAISATE
jgi:hypothetical protein